MEHRFITTNDGFIRAIAICRQRLLNCTADSVMNALLNRRLKQSGNIEAGVIQVRTKCKLAFLRVSARIQNSFSNAPITLIVRCVASIYGQILTTLESSSTLRANVN